MCLGAMAMLRADAAKREELQTKRNATQRQVAKELRTEQEAQISDGHQVVDDLFGRGLCLAQLIRFVKDRRLEDCTLTTGEVVRKIILRETRAECCAMTHLLPHTIATCAFKERVCIPSGGKPPQTFFSHSWKNKFIDLVKNVILYYTGLVSFQWTDFTVSQLESAFWIDIFAVNQHASLCSKQSKQVDSCDCWTPKWAWGNRCCEVDKFDRIIRRCQDHVIIIDEEFAVLKRLWVLCELWEALAHDRRSTVFGPVPEIDTEALEDFCSLKEATASSDEDKKQLIQRIMTGPTAQTMEMGVKIKVQRELFRRRLFNSATDQHWEDVYQLLRDDEELAKCHDPAKNDGTILHVVCGNDDDISQVVARLLEMKAEANAREGKPFERAPVHIAVEKGHYGICKALHACGSCDFGARRMPDAKTAADVALDAAAGIVQRSTAEASVRRFSKVWRRSSSADAIASTFEAQQDEIDRRQVALQLASDLKRWKHPTLSMDEAHLFRSAAAGESCAVVDLLEKDAKLALAKDPSYAQYTALHFVCECRGAGPLVAELVSRKADVNARSTRPQHGGVGHWTPLHCAAYHGHRAAVLALLTLRADPHVADSAGKTPEDWAAKHNFGDVVSLLASCETMGPEDHVTLVI
eukprot:TRINITY_DN18570_c0_g2_i2.p1 TRINITY_DN18570_c0_g2~~TRINITY_DN18570_c0_g2_i2.p1  ORF type:complete len:638 (-),score=159.93 TRINITY_DN18570_c0_g2_i2:75-1988(-)